MLQRGVYRTEKPGLTTEKHGGANIDHYVYLYLCFYIPQTYVALYGTSRKDYFKPYEKNNIDLKGEITHQEGSILEFYILNKDTDVNIRFHGTVEGDRLHLRYFHEDKPQEVFEDVFQYIGTGENRT